MPAKAGIQYPATRRAGDRSRRFVPVGGYGIAWSEPGEDNKEEPATIGDTKESDQ
jgi:hypothetical protein